MLKTDAIKSNKSKTLISLKNISKSYGEFVVLKNISFIIHGKEKIGLVGPNGVGKSTLFKIIVGELDLDDGVVEKYAKTRPGYISQEVFKRGRADQKVVDFLKEYTGLDEEGVRQEAESFVHRLQLKKNVLDSNIGELSGGEKGKISIIRVMIAPFDIFFLDEPTNNLDLPTLHFLEDFISKSNKAFLIISHDREFLDRTVKKIVEIDEFTRELSIYDGNFSDYIKQHKKKIEQEWVRFKDSQEKIAKLDKATQSRIEDMKKIDKAFKDKRKLSHKITDKNHIKKGVLRGKAGKAGKQAKVFEKRLEKVKEESPEKPKRKLPLKIKFEIAEISGDKVFDMQGVRKRVNSFEVGPVDLAVRRGERVLILGSNGTGKTTLLKILLNKIAPDHGTVVVGERVRVGYLPQTRDIDEGSTVREQLLKYTEMEEGVARRLLNRFGISEEDINKKVGELSPGEYSRLLLALTMTQKANCLIFDEPSNHLDLEVLEQLEGALKDFEGTLVVVSHDRRFIDNIGITKAYLLKEGTLKEIAGYHKYEESL